MHEACGFAYTIVRSHRETCNPVNYRGEDAVCVFAMHFMRRGSNLGGLGKQKATLDDAQRLGKIPKRN